MKSLHSFLVAVLFLTTILALSAFAQNQPSGQLLKNPGFETVSEGNIADWGGTPIAVTSAVDKAAEGKRSVKLSSDAPDFAPIAAQNVMGSVQNQHYHMSYQVCSAKAGQEFRLYVGIWQGTEWVDGADTDWRKGAEAWQKISFDFDVTKPANRLMVVLQMKGPATVWFDALSLTASPLKQKETVPPTSANAPSQPAQPASSQSASKTGGKAASKPTVVDGEMLINGGFEDVQNGVITGWGTSPVGVSSSTEMITEGKRSIKLTGEDKDIAVIATQSVGQFSLNQKYRLTYQARGAKIGQEYRVYIGVWEGQNWVTGIDSDWRQSADVWQKVSTDFTLTQPANRLEVVLQVKAPGTMWFDNVSLAPAPKVLLPPALAKYQGSPDFVQIMPDRTFRVAGKPFFPIKIWGWNCQTEEAMATAHDFGFNVIATGLMDSYGPHVMSLLLDMAHKYHLMVIPAARVELPSAQAAELLPAKLEELKSVVDKIKNHPALFAYNIADEPALAQYDLLALAKGALMIRADDPNHPIYINHAPRNTIAELARYNQYDDIAGSDIYPVWKDGIDKHSNLPNKTISVVGDETIKNLEAVDYAKPVWETLQAFSWSAPPSPAGLSDEPFPTHQQLRFMGYYTIVCGATGISFYQDQRYTVLRPELKSVVGEFAALRDVLAGGTLLKSDTVLSTPEVKVLAKEWKGHRILIAVNHTNQEVKAQLNWNALSDGKTVNIKLLKVLFEDRTVAPQSGVVTDTFKPYDVHVYTDAPNEADVLHAFMPINVASSDVEQTAAIRAKFDMMVPRAGRTNLALASNGTTVTCSSELGAMKATYVNDGDRWGGQWNDATRNEYPDWVTLEFPKIETIQQIAIYSSDIEVMGHSSSDGIRDFEVQEEENGQWKSIYAVKNHDSVVSVINLPQPVTTKKIRVWVTATAGSGDYTRIREIEVYAPDK